MSSSSDSWEDHFKSDETALIYDRQTGVTKAVADDIISQYLKSDSLEGKVVLDNACGTGVVTMQLLAHTINLKIEAADLADPMVAYLKKSIPTGASVNAQVMNAQELTYPDNAFDLSITVMGVMFIPDSDKALNHLYRVTKPGGKCFITTWHRLEHFEIAERLIRRLRPDQGPLKLWQVPWDDPEYLKAQLAKAGFRDCGVETKLEYILYPGEEGLEFGAEMVPNLYARLITLRDGEEEKWNRLWREVLQRENYSKEGVRMKMWANIAWGSN